MAGTGLILAKEIVKMVTEYFFPDREILFSALLIECVDKLNGAIAEKQTATLLVSGGGTPKPLYEQLSLQALDWPKVNVALVDERWVDANQAGSNQTFVMNNLLINKAVAANYIAMKGLEASAVLGQEKCEQRYSQLSVPFDLTILGMGPDGHTASLFPNANGLIQALDEKSNHLCRAINAHPSDVTGSLTERMSLSLFGLLQSRELHLLITGEEKLAVYKKALTSTDVRLTPISALLQQTRVPVKVFWAP
jgi:6-phosphogluconolactonase